ncbi:50S ribosomal protein L4 [Rhodoferax sp. 4810]|uniref:Large ribosomal subunit protein uL4 n=1 Tax=Thiospirillum jenense TaxID=1653858 RepID=A0A839H473_9GAMM|nr:50S ribosomal protein L4 [Thiospirillum jenense]MBB1073025.1 50S ribosomal protein L4 [Rhodoferax jenense]MBB1124973.1 50S ribosomal protein L4 [Thiospirillum jenense]
MQLVTRNKNGDFGEISVSDHVFGLEYKPGLVHQVITAYLANARSGTRAQKNRAAVSGGGAKPHRQKGTGRARAGTSRSPLWRSGGRTFAAQPQSFAQKVNRKMYRSALRSILSELVRQERLLIVPNFELTEVKTKALANKLAELAVTNDVLILVDEVNTPLTLASRNLPNVDVLTARMVDPVSLVAFAHIIATEAAITKLEERLI